MKRGEKGNQRERGIILGRVLNNYIHSTLSPLIFCIEILTEKINFCACVLNNHAPYFTIHLIKGKHLPLM